MDSVDIVDSSVFAYGGFAPSESDRALALTVGRLRLSNSTLELVYEESAPPLRIEAGSAVILEGERSSIVRRTGAFTQGGQSGGLSIVRRDHAALQVILDGGSLVTTANDLRYTDGISLTADSLVMRGGRITTNETGNSTRGGGPIEIDVRRFRMQENSQITSSDELGNAASGGRIRITAAESARITASSITASIAVDEGLERQGFGATSGSVEIKAGEAFILEAGSEIAANSGFLDAKGGQVNIEAERIVRISGSTITANVRGGTGGNLRIDPVLVLLEKGSRLTANASEPNSEGGAVRINSKLFLKDAGSVIEASAGPAGIAGTVEINAPDVDITGSLLQLPGSFLDAASLLRERCAARRAGAAGSFVVGGRGGLPASPDDALAAGAPAEAGVSHGGSEPQAAPELAGLVLRSEGSDELDGVLFGCVERL